MNDWFAVSKKGLAKQVAGVPRSKMIFELLSNAWDEDVDYVEVSMLPVEGRPVVFVHVSDNSPQGFTDLSHAWTLFAESKKAGTANKRGRFNLGEKLFLALCHDATIRTTTGTVTFNEGGRVVRPSQRTEAGSVIEANVRMTREEYNEVLEGVRQLICPENVHTFINGWPLTRPKVLTTFMTALPTVLADEEGTLRPTVRNTTVEVFSLEGHLSLKPGIYEMGIPVVETDWPYAVNVMQKVPLNRDRDNVTPGFLQTLRVEVFNQTHKLLEKDDFSSTWARMAVGDERAREEAVTASLDARFGEKRVAYDPTDQEANRIAASKGYTVVPGGALSGGEWSRAKSFGGIAPAGQVTPSPKPYGVGGDPLNTIEKKDWTPGQTKVADFAKRMAEYALNRKAFTVSIANDIKWPFAATYGGGHLVLNHGRLGKSFFEEFPSNVQRVVELLIHEFAHEGKDGKVVSHLCEEFDDNMARIGAKFTELALTNKKLFR